ncbi:MAG: hypothetical protein J1D77_08440 [Muribaculaceae bacterium]|nr:hypothetical protein [Muribaculaceae bacterium]
MKKLLLLTALGLAGFAAQAADYTVYNNGVVAEGLALNDWWNVYTNYVATDPAGGTNKVLEVKAGNLTYDWGQGGYKDASMGIQTSDLSIIGPLSTSTLNFSWYKIGTGDYEVKLTWGPDAENKFQSINFSNGGQANQWNTASIKISDYPNLSEAWASVNEATSFAIFSVVLTNGAENDVIYISNVYYSGLDESYEEPAAPVYETPDYVIAPTQSPSNVLSIFSSAYEPATTFNIGQWGQSTTVENLEIDDQTVEFLKNFNYLGWEFLEPNKFLDVTDYEYLHVEYWTAEGTNFGISPITSETGQNGQSQNWLAVAQGQEVKQGEWNIYDIPLSYFSNLDLEYVFQMQFAEGGNAYGYLANVYFWKEGEPSTPVQAPANLYLLGDTYAWNQELVTSWKPESGLAFTPGEGDGIFTIKGVQFNSQTSYFTFTNILDSDWEVVNDGTHRYCPVTLLDAASLVSENPFGLGQGQDLPDSWTIAPGVYDFTVDFNTLTFTVAISDVEEVLPPEVTTPDALYLIGNLAITDGKWIPEKGEKFKTTTEGIFTLEGIEIVGAEGGNLGYFAFTNILDSDWDVIENGTHRYGPSVDSEASLEKANAFEFSNFTWNITPGIYDFTVNFNTQEMTVAKSKSDAVNALRDNGQEGEVYYNLQGVRVANPQHGIYILNGKKVLVK